MKVERYFHLRNKADLFGGATVRVVGDTTYPQVEVQFVKCSKKDHYVKKVGRELVKKAPTKMIALRYLPNYLRDIYDACNPYASFANEFDYSVFYFLPKEL